MNKMGIWFVLGLLALLMSSCGGSTSANDPQLKEKVLDIIKENPEAIIEAVRSHQKNQQQKQEQALENFLKEMKKDPKSVIGNSPSQGSKEQKIVLLEFSDFQCPFCAKTHEVIKKFLEKNKDKVTFVYKHFPLTNIHKEAMPSAKASWAAGQQGKFWEYHDALFENQSRLGEPLYIEIAKKLNLDLDKFNKDRDSSAAAKAVQDDIDLGEKAGVFATPFLMMNGVFVPKAELEILEATLEEVSQ